MKKMAITANKQKRQFHYIREGAFAYLQTVMRNCQASVKLITVIVLLKKFNPISFIFRASIFLNQGVVFV